MAERIKIYENEVIGQAEYPAPQQQILDYYSNQTVQEKGMSSFISLDNISDGMLYSKILHTGILKGKLVVAGLDSAVTARMFTDSNYKTNIEAWRHASDVTLIDGGDIYTGSITALGIVTAGSFICSTSGYIRGGQTAYDTGIGFWLGYDSAAYKFSIGNSAGNKLTWDGSALSITGAITGSTITGGIITGAIMKVGGDSGHNVLLQNSLNSIRFRYNTTAMAEFITFYDAAPAGGIGIVCDNYTYQTKVENYGSATQGNMNYRIYNGSNWKGFILFRDASNSYISIELDDLVPALAVGGNLGTPAHIWNTCYVNNLNVGSNIVVLGLVDGVDIAAHDGGAITTYHTGTIGSTMHGTLTGIPNAHHTKTTSLPHSSITGITASQHHSSTSSGYIIYPSSIQIGGSAGYTIHLLTGDIYAGGGIKAGNVDLGYTNSYDLLPYASDYGSIGYQARHWDKIYANTFYSDNNEYLSFQKHNDIDLIKAIKIKTVKEKKVWNLGNLPKEIFSENKKMIKTEAMSGFLIGTIKQLIEKVESLEAQIQ